MKMELADRRPRGLSQERRGRPGASAGRHYHDGHEVGFVLEGTAILEVEGQPPIELKPGDHYHIDASKHIGASKPHDVRNTGAAPGQGQAAPGRRALMRPAG